LRRGPQRDSVAGTPPTPTHPDRSGSTGSRARLRSFSRGWFRVLGTSADLATIRGNRALISSIEAPSCHVTVTQSNDATVRLRAGPGPTRMGCVPSPRPTPARLDEVRFFEPNFATPVGHDATVTVGSPTYGSRTHPASHPSPPSAATTPSRRRRWRPTRWAAEVTHADRTCARPPPLGLPRQPQRHIRSKVAARTDG
jgi:hypothetical protein